MIQERPVERERTPAVSKQTLNTIKALEKDLRSAVIGEVRFDDGSRAMYSTDGSNYRQVPIGVVIPFHAEDTVQTIETCRRYGAPVLLRAGGTSLAGQSCNVAVLIDTSKYFNNIIELDPDRRLARVQPGVILDQLRNEAEKHHLTFAPDPATHSHNCLGGMIGNNSCGIHSVMGGKTVDNIEELEILTYDGLKMRVGRTSDEELEQIIGEGGRRGEIYAKMRDLRDKYADLIREKYPKIPRRVSGYNLDQLLPENGFHIARALVGSEGTLVTVLEATCRLIYSPPIRSLLLLGYPDVYSAGDHVSEVMEYGPTACEGIDDGLIEDMETKGLHSKDIRLLPDGRGWLIVEFGGETKEEAQDKARRLMHGLKRKKNAPTMKLFEDKSQERLVWEIRESGLGATANVPGRPLTWPGWEDSAVPPDKVGAYLRDFRKLLDKYGYMCDLYGHFGQGCIHVRIDFDFFTADGIAKYKSFINEAADIVVGYGGSLSGEHGDGQSRAELLPKMYGEDLLQAFREFKAIWDPQWKMNPGKVVDPYRVDQNLRLGSDYNPPKLKTHFRFRDDEGSFSRATLRCVGVGKCRRLDEGTMCPSFMATREEKDTTRGRARLLFEMLEGDPLEHQWRNDAVKDALDLCLSCKGCKGDCPVNVDVATYRAEFLCHYFAGRLRPRQAYAFGLIFRWARLAEIWPGFANFVTQTPGLRWLFKEAIGVQQDRQMPQFAPQTFKQWFRRREPKNVGSPQVILWADTFNNHFFPEVAKAAVEVLEHAGYNVTVPMESLCCGRPLYDYGMLDTAEKYLRKIMDVLGPQLEEGTPIVGLEPSCISVFRDELIDLFPDDPRAQRLHDQSFLLSEFLNSKAEGYTPPRLEGKAVLHVHCHHKSVLDKDSDDRLLGKMGVEFEFIDDGCCGMAGGFGFTKGAPYAVSTTEGERVLLPAVRQAESETVIVTSGFSCREQIEQMSNRQALHPSQILQIAIREGKTTAEDGEFPETPFVREREKEVARARRRAGIIVGTAGALAAGGAIAWAVRRGKSR